MKQEIGIRLDGLFIEVFAPGIMDAAVKFAETQPASDRLEALQTFAGYALQDCISRGVWGEPWEAMRADLLSRPAGSPGLHPFPPSTP